MIVALAVAEGNWRKSEDGPQAQKLIVSTADSKEIFTTSPQRDVESMK